MATTTNRQYPFPTLDDLPNGPSEIEALAEAVDRDVQTLATAQAAATVWNTTGIVGTTPTGATSGTGLATVTDQYWAREGNRISINFGVTLGAAITVGATGNTPNTPVALVPALGRPTGTYSQPLTSRATGPVCIWTISSNGLVQLCATVPGMTLPAGTLLSCGGVVLA